MDKVREIGMGRSNSEAEEAHNPDECKLQARKAESNQHTPTATTRREMRGAIDQG